MVKPGGFTSPHPEISKPITLFCTDKGGWTHQWIEFAESPKANDWFCLQQKFRNSKAKNNWTNCSGSLCLEARNL